ncbi:MAG: MoaD family protein [Sulfolobales archaeon]
MNIKVRYYALFRELVRRSEEILSLRDDTSLKELLNELARKYPKLGSFIDSGAYIVLRNSHPISDADLKTALKEGDVVDLMPPSSGGSIEVRLLRKDDNVSLDELIREVKTVNGIETSGAIAIYVGFVKGVVNGVKVRELVYESNEEFTLRALNRILQEVVAKNDRIKAVKVLHRVGSYRQGDEVFYVIVAGVSRRDVIPALTEIVERVKHETGIWKLEIRDDGSYWVLGDGVRVRSEGSNTS